ncbi:MAG: CBS domain-containing protein, partial [Actinobacteria bacterium]|nr:CBS domain-containing protein [Actinomycetota bacterium]
GKGLAYTLILLGIFGIVVYNIGFAWFIFLGWILLQAANSGYQRVIYREALEGIKVGQAMTQNPETVNPDISIEEMVKEHFMQHHWIAYPVVENGDVRGVITIKSIEGLPRRSWKRKRVRDVMRPLSLDIVTRPETDIPDILSKLNTKAEGRMLVMKGGRLVGILTKLDVSKAIVRRLQSERETRRPAA